MKGPNSLQIQYFLEIKEIFENSKTFCILCYLTYVCKEINVENKIKIFVHKNI